MLSNVILGLEDIFQRRIRQSNNGNTCLVAIIPKLVEKYRIKVKATRTSNAIINV